MELRYESSLHGRQYRRSQVSASHVSVVFSYARDQHLLRQIAWKQGSLNHQVDNYPHTTPFRVLGMLDLIFSCSTQIRFVRFHSIRSQ